MRAYRYKADVSSNNGVVDIANYSKAGHAAIAIKATEGVGYTNPFHLEQCKVAHDKGLTVVHYHFCRPGENNVNGEIAHFRNTYLKGWRKGDYIAVDLEVNEGGNLGEYGTSFCERIYRATGHPPILYTYVSFASEHLSRTRVPGNRWWIAKYSPGSPKLGKPLSLWAWQYSDGEHGPDPHYYAGIGKCDGSILTYGVAIRMWVRKLRTRKR